MKNLKQNFIAIVMALIVAAPAMAISVPGWERPLRQAPMTVVEGTLYFENVQDVSLSINKQDGAGQVTSMTLKYKTQNGETIDRTVPVTQKPVTNGCGTLIYTAELPQMEKGTDTNEEKMTITLEDHANRRCRDIRRGQWEAKVVYGYVITDSIDSELSIYGNPEAVYTIMTGSL